MGFEKLQEKIFSKGNPTVMGLDPKLEYVPEFLREGKSIREALFEFNKGLIDCCADLIPAVKPQAAYYEMYGLEGLSAMWDTIKYASEAGLYVILDAKRGDIGSTADAYAKAYLSAGTGIDCMTVNPYFGTDGVKPFITTAEQNGKTIFILAKTSNPSASELQDIDCGGIPMYRHAANKINEWGNSVCGAVVGATQPIQLIELRQAFPDMFFLIPGYGAQGGAASDIAHAFNSNRGGAIVNSSRGLMCAYSKVNDPLNFKTHTRNAVIDMKNDLTSVLK